jgi:hypothetical protein
LAGPTLAERCAYYFFHCNLHHVEDKIVDLLLPYEFTSCQHLLKISAAGVDLPLNVLFNPLDFESIGYQQKQTVISKLERTIIHNMSGNSSNFILLIFDSLLHNLKVGGLV